MRKLTIARSAEEITPFATLWESIASDSRHTIFQQFAWNQLAARTFANEQPPFVVVAEDDSGAAIIPACIDKQQGRMSLLGEELFDYRDVLHIGDPALLQSAWREVLSFAAEHSLGFGFHSYRTDAAADHWHNLPLTSFTHAPCAFAHDIQQTHAHLEVNLRRLVRAGVTRSQYSGADSELLRRIYALKSNEPDSLFRGEQRLEMLLAMARSAAEQCEVFTLESGSTLVAGLVTFRDHTWRRFYTTYFDRAWAKHSPGSTLLYLVMQESLAAGLDCDLMTGDQPYKLRLATDSVPLYRVSGSAQQIRAKVPSLFAMAI